MIGTMKPARPEADDDVLCDLDAIVTKRVTFIFQGKTHVLLPITTQRFMEFWDGSNKFQASDQKDAKAANEAFVGLIRIVAPSLSLSEAEAMTMVQKAALIRHIAAKIVGVNLIEKKKSLTSQEISQESAS